MSKISSIPKPIVGFFDEAYYLKHYGHKIPEGFSAWGYFFEIGWRHGDNPSECFDTIWYLIAYPDVRAAGLCPLVHYVADGAVEGRLPKPMPNDRSSIASKLIAAFDSDYYRSNNPDVVEANIVPLIHYLDEGWREGRQPRKDFLPKNYTASHPELAGQDLPPFVHAIENGVEFGQSGATTALTVRRSIIEQARSPRAQMEDWTVRTPRVVQDASALLSRFAELESEFSAGLIISFSHDDYVEIFGGVQNCVGDEQISFNRKGWTYLHLRPSQPLPLLSDTLSPEELLVNLRLDGKPIGTSSLSSIMTVVNKIRGKYPQLHVVIHHMLGFSPEAVQSGILSVLADTTSMWIHDFFTLCGSSPLLRNNLEFCGGPPPSSAACRVCCFGSERLSHFARMRKLIAEVQPRILAPSQTALTFWLDRIGLEVPHTSVLPHGQAQESGKRDRTPGPIRVAFVGAPVYHKGWITFDTLVQRFHDDGRYKFFHFGMSHPNIGPYIKQVPVSVSSENRNAMIEAVREADIDVVVQWSLCYETFSFTVYEAMAAGAFIVARRAAGNVWPAVSDLNASRGVALSDEDELFDLFTSEELAQNIGRKIEFDFVRNGITSELFAEKKNV